MISAKSLFAAELAGIIEPDFSCYTDLPRTVQIWNVYRARWVGRLWQSVGLKVIPCVSWADEASFEFCLSGIPERSASICIECRPRFKDGALLREGIEQVVERLKPVRVLLYGATKAFAAKCPVGPEYVWLPAWSPRLRLKQG
jgi:hypothetical protein